MDGILKLISAGGFDRAVSATKATVLRLRRRLSGADTGSSHLAGQIKDYVEGGSNLLWQRQGSYLAATALVGYYYDAKIAVACFMMLQFTEFVDHKISIRVRRWDGKGKAKTRCYHNLLTVSTVLSATAVSLFAVLVARQDIVSVHITPLFFLFGAALFAAMNNHQLIRVLLIRLAIYGVAFLYIPTRDLWTVQPPLGSFLWLEFGICLFVLCSIANCSVIFLRNYRRGLSQMEELRQERDKAQAAYELKSQFVSIVSHELRTPLTSIKGGLSLLQSGVAGKVPAELQKIVNIAHKNSNRLALLIDDLLDLQKLEAGQMIFHFSDVDVLDLVQESIDAIDGYRKSMEVSFRLSCDCKHPVISGDYDRLMQVMANILSNAVKFSEQGGFVDVKIDQHGPNVRIGVRDYGIGIPEGCEDKVFGRFSQVDSRDRRKVGGSGLGMNIAKQIVDGHNGVIGYTSILNAGTTFFVEIALQENAEQQQA